MTAYYVEIRFTVEPALDMDGFSDSLMDALLDEPNVDTPDLGVQLRRGVVDASMVVEVDDHVEAMRTGFVALRSALHNVGTGTPGWEADLDRALATVRPPEPADA